MAVGKQIVVPKLSSAEALSFTSPDSNPPGETDQLTDRRRGHFALRRSTATPSRANDCSPMIPTVIIDMSALRRAGLVHILAGSRFRVTACCSQLSALPKSAFGERRCIALIGLDKDTDALLSEISSLKERHKGLRIVILCDKLQPDQVLAAIEAGADGYLLLSELGPDVLLKSLELVLVEGVVVPQGFTKLLNGRAKPDHAPAVQPLEAISDCAPPLPVRESVQTDDLVRLSNREHAILMHLTLGASNKHIARELNITEATVKVHVKGVLRKIRVNNRTQAAMWAINHLPPADRLIRSRLPDPNESPSR